MRDGWGWGMEYSGSTLEEVQELLTMINTNA